MNNLKLESKNRIVRKKEEKAKRKIIIQLVEKWKVDKRTYRNLKEIFSFIGNHEEFTGPQIQRNRGIEGSSLYPLLDSLKRRGLIEEAGSIKSAGRGETKVYRLTLAGKIVASYVNDDSNLLISALKEIAEKEVNPLKRFLIEAFIENYPCSLMQEVLEISISRIKSLEDGLELSDLLGEVFEEAFVIIPFLEKEDSELEQIFRKNIELMEKSPYKEWIFLYFKMRLESIFLYGLEGEKLSKYVEALRKDPQLLHIPCDNPECTNVIVVDNLTKINKPCFCGKCKVEKGVSE